MRRNLSPVTCKLSPTSLSSDENLPITDEPTRDFSSTGRGEFDSMSFSGEHGPLESRFAVHDVPVRLGDYVVGDLIGSGGMGNVYAAEHTRMGRTVAIKMLPVKRMKDAKAIERFYDEVRAASRLMHPNIVTAFDAGETDDGIHYLAMEFVDGVTLTRWVAMRGPLPVGEAAAIIRQAALGLLHAHRAGIIHRDVKPGNLMRATDGTIKVLDLGLARIANADVVPVAKAKAAKDSDDHPLEIIKSNKGRLVGTLPFMSPEQLEDPDSADARSDIYSLGATMYFLLTASPPFVGEYLDQVYGHRHGEIPDLMQARGDVDLHFANIFNRMMAKKPQERYESLDEVIDDLSEYASQTDAPVWLTEFANKMPGGDSSTFGGNSTYGGGATQVFAIDFGMFYSATAMAAPTGEVEQLQAGGPAAPLFRMALASEDETVIYGQAAIERRAEQPQSLLHCLPMYIGKPIVERKVAGRACPPEVLMAMLIRKIWQNAWIDDDPPQASAITVPACYDQLHRRSILRAASIAGLRSVRLVDRSIAAVQSLLIASPTDAAISAIGPDAEQTVLFVGVSGQATEIAVVRRDSARLHQLATAGHWHLGTLPWLHKLVDLAASAFQATHGIDPRKQTKTAALLQIACERAMNAMLLAPTATIKIISGVKELSVAISRQTWIDACDGLAMEITAGIARACEQASVRIGDIDVCVTMGAVMRLAAVRDRVLAGLRADVQRRAVDRTDVARGAAACLAAELPGRGDIAMPPRVVSGQTIGIVIEDAKGRRRILPIIPQGTLLPARTNRRLTVGKQRPSMTLSLVESSGVTSEDWQSLGRHEIDVSQTPAVTSRTMGFEINVNGLLSVRAQAAGSGASARLPTLPAELLTEEEVAMWTRWIEGLK